MIHRTNLNCLFILLLAAITVAPGVAFSSNASIPDFETARLKSTAGAGVGSILIDEATLLNPASIALFNMTSIYAQKNKDTITPDNVKDFPTKVPTPDEWGGIISDASNDGLKGSVSYQKQKYLFNERTRYALAGAGMVGSKSALGITYRHSSDRISEDNLTFKNKKYNQMVIGVIHVISEAFSLGTILVDPLRGQKEDTRVIVGAQYNYLGFISLIFDAGGDYNNDLSKSFLYKAAIQIQVFSELYLRAGTFYDKGNDEKGNGMGVAWVQPKLAFEMAMKNTTVNTNVEKKQNGAKFKEVAFALSFRF